MTLTVTQTLFLSRGEVRIGEIVSPGVPTRHNEFTVVYEKEDDWYIGYCLEIPGANGQGKTKEECRSDLACAIALILKDRREDGMRSIPYGVKPETIVIPDALPEGEYAIL